MVFSGVPCGAQASLFAGLGLGVGLSRLDTMGSICSLLFKFAVLICLCLAVLAHVNACTQFAFIQIAATHIRVLVKLGERLNLLALKTDLLHIDAR
jgi:hypothetical protein